MARRIFISYQHADQMKAKGFNLLRWNKNVDLEFVGRHLLDPVDSTNADYIGSQIKDQLKGTSVTVVLLGKETCDSTWVRDEIEWSLEKENPNGIVAIRLDSSVPLPLDSPVGKALNDAGAEIIGWEPDKFGDAIERAARSAGRAKLLRSAVASAGGGSCGR
jgi:hypothetical protein